jgi:hypothetical protein
LRCRRTIPFALAFVAASGLLFSQEAASGIDLRATISGEAMYSNGLGGEPRDSSSIDGGVRAVLYPTIKLSDHWSLAGAIEGVSRPWDEQDLTRPGNGFRGRVVQASLAYSTVWKGGSLIVKAGEMPSAFGSFLLRYDDAENPLVSVPSAYGYYYNPVTLLGLAGAQADVTLGKLDARLQFTNSSPANPRSVFDKDQYANWAGGAGYTIRQGLRVGFSGYRGPYLDRHYAFYFPGEAEPRDLPASGIGIDADWAAGHWNVHGEWQRFVMTYHVIPDFYQNTGYAEVKRVLNPRWFVAARIGYLHTSVLSGEETFECAAGFRPDSHQIVKAGYLVSRSQRTGDLAKTFVLQVVTSLHPFSMAWR